MEKRNCVMTEENVIVVRVPAPSGERQRVIEFIFPNWMRDECEDEPKPRERLRRRRRGAQM